MNIDNYKFVLALDTNQLSHSVSTMYGVNMDSRGYLKRFIDYEFKLPTDKVSIYIDECLNSLSEGEKLTGTYFLIPMLKNIS